MIISANKTVTNKARLQIITSIQKEVTCRCAFPCVILAKFSFMLLVLFVITEQLSIYYLSMIEISLHLSPSHSVMDKKAATVSTLHKKNIFLHVF